MTGCARSEEETAFIQNFINGRANLLSSLSFRWGEQTAILTMSNIRKIDLEHEAKATAGKH